jgi:two-component system KDP operon response regulator KdpE
VRLTRTEYRLLAALVKHAGKVLTHRQLLVEVWGPGSANETHLPARLHGAAAAQARGQPGAPAPLLTETGVGCGLRAE